jgi:glutamate carboxypeptidase
MHTHNETIEIKDELLQETIEDLGLLKKFVDVHSPTKCIEGVNKVQELLACELFKLGFDVRFHQTPLQYGQTIVAEKKGRRSECISFIGHADSVLGVTRTHHFRFSEDKKRVIGPGVADNKGGLVVALRALKTFLKTYPEHEYTLRFISSANEEIGSVGYTDFFQVLGTDTAYAFGMEPALECGSIISSRNGNRWYKIVTYGRSDHAGRVEKLHLNAAHELCMKIAKFHELNDFPNRRKVNVGSFAGGTGHFNVICGKAEAKIDIRFPTIKDRDELHQIVDEVIATNFAPCSQSQNTCYSVYSIEDDCPPMEEKKNSKEYINYYLDHLNEEDLHRSTGGAADVCYLSHENNIALDGLGPIAGELHTTSEYADIDSFHKRSNALASLLEYIESKSIAH